MVDVFMQLWLVVVNAVHVTLDFQHLQVALHV